MCDWVGRILTHVGWIEDQPYELLYEHPDGHQLCEHKFPTQNPSDMMPFIVAVNGIPLAMGAMPELIAGDRIVIYARQEDQRKWTHCESGFQ